MGNWKQHRTRRIVQTEDNIRPQYCTSGRNKISDIGGKTKDEIMVLMVQLGDQRIAGKDHESEAVTTVLGIP